jgi:exopolysaccharide biosynthesis polyprenyl glycosylphosphotransferase
MSAKVIFLILIDSLILLLACLLAGLTITSGKIIFHSHILQAYLIFAPIILFIFYIEGLYTFETYDPTKLSLSLFRGMCFTTVIGFGFAKIFSSNLEYLSVIAIGLIVPYMVTLARKIVFEILSKDFMMQNALLIGASDTMKYIQSETSKKPFMGYRVRGMLTPEQMSFETIPSDIELVAIERNFTRTPMVLSYLESGIEIMDLANFTEQLTGKIPLSSIDESWFVEHCGHRRSSVFAISKRALDIFTSITLMLLLIPVAIILIPILLIVHGRPIFFSQARTGLNKKSFTLFKLRTMVINAEKGGAVWCKPGDMRITPLGKWLRKTRLDELPQLWNILRGEMTLVGPRPERPEIIKDKLEKAIPYYNLRHLVKPGVTGWAQISFRYGFSTEDSLEKLQYDLFYVKNRSLWLDVLIILKTIKTVLTGAGQ